MSHVKYFLRPMTPRTTLDGPALSDSVANTGGRCHDSNAACAIGRVS
jgi:hypothetical protein